MKSHVHIAAIGEAALSRVMYALRGQLWSQTHVLRHM